MIKCTQLENNAHWLLRLSIASVFIYHGADKLPKLEMVSGMLGMPYIVVLALALVEVAGGVLVLAAPLLGDMKDKATRAGALMLMPVMLGAIGMVHWGQWTFMATPTHPMGGMEFQVTLLLVLLYLFIKGEEA